MDVNKDFNYAFALSRQCLRILGVWPNPNTPQNNIRRPNVRFVIVACILSFYVIVPQLNNMIRAWGNITRMVECLISVNFSLMALCYLVTTWYHGKALRTIITSVMNDWLISKSDWERSTMLKIARRGRSLSFRCYVIYVSSAVFYAWFHSLKMQRSIHQPQKILVYPSVYPYNTQRSPNYEITFVLQVSGGVYSGLVNCTVDSFISMLLLHVCAQLKNLRRVLNNKVDELANKTISTWRFKEILAAIVIRHEHLMNNARTVIDCYSDVLFMQVLASTFLLCFESFEMYEMITDRNSNVNVVKIVFLFFFAGCVLTQFYNYCYAGEKLITESTSMADGVYECKWYDLPPENARDLMLIVYRSKIPLQLTAGKFGVFSMEMFGMTIKTSLGYLSALLTIKD